MADLNSGMGGSPPAGGNPEAIQGLAGRTTVGSLGLGSFESNDSGLKTIHQELTKVNEDLAQMKRTIDSLSPALMKLNPAFTKTIGLFSKLLGKNLGNNASQPSVNTASTAPDVGGLLGKRAQQIQSTTTTADVSSRYGAEARANRAAGQVTPTTTTAQVTFGTRPWTNTSGQPPTSPGYAVKRAAITAAPVSGGVSGADARALVAAGGAGPFAGGGEGTTGPAGPDAAGSGGGNRNTTANVRTPNYGRAVAGEMLAQTAGSVNTYMANVQQNVAGLYAQGAQIGAVYGGSPGVNTAGLSWSKNHPNQGFYNTGGADLSNAVGTLMSNPLLQNQLQNRNLQKFGNFAQTLNPSLGASGAADIMSQLTNGATLQTLGRRSGSVVSQGILANPTTGKVNDTQTALLNTLKGITAEQNLTPDRLKQLATGNQGRNWLRVTTNATAAGLQPDTVQLLKQFAASGGNLKTATSKMDISNLSALQAESQTTSTQSNAYDKTQGSQKFLNNFNTALEQAKSSLMNFSTQLDNLVNVGASGTAAALGGGGVGGSIVSGLAFSGGQSVAKKIGGTAAVTAVKSGAKRAGTAVIGGIAKTVGGTAAGAAAIKYGGKFIGRFGTKAASTAAETATGAGEATASGLLGPTGLPISSATAASTTAASTTAAETAGATTAATDAGYVAVGGLGAVTAVAAGVAVDAYLGNKDYHLYFGMRAAQSDAEKAAKRLETADKKWANDAAGVWQDSPDGKVLAKRVITAGTQTGMRPGNLIINHHKKWFIDKDGKAQTKDTVNIHPAAKNSHATKGDPTYGLSVSDIPPMGDPGTGSTTTGGLQPQLSQRMQAMMRANPSIKISSGHRTASQQQNLYNLKGGKGVARPGHSEHQSGKAADIGPPSQFGWISKNAQKFGLHLPAPTSEPWHIQAMGDPVSSPVGAGLTLGRTDQGVDYTGKGDVYAVAAGTIISLQNKGWNMGAKDDLGAFIAIKLDKPLDAAHSVVYYAESIVPTVRIGQHVSAGQKIGYATGATHGIEIGWGDPNAVGAATSHGAKGATDDGKNFLKWISGGTVPAGTGSTDAGAGSTGGSSTSTSKASGTKASTSGGGGIGGLSTNSFFSSVSSSWLGSGGGGVGGGTASSVKGSGSSASVGNTTIHTGNTTVMSGSANDNSISNPTEFSKALLASLGLPATVADVTSINAWQQHEGQWGASGAFQSEKMFNPLNTFYKMPGSKPLTVNGKAATLAYKSWKDGITASKKTINQGNMAGILKALQANADLKSFTGALESSPWAGSHYGGGSFDTPSGAYSVMGDPVGGTEGINSAMAYTTPKQLHGPAGVSNGGVATHSTMSFSMPNQTAKSSGPVTINMPIQVVGVTQQDAKHLAKMVINELNSSSNLSTVSRN